MSETNSGIRRHVPTVNVVPEVFSFLKDFTGIAEGKHNLALARCHHPAGPKEAVPSDQDRVKHGFV